MDRIPREEEVWLYSHSTELLDLRASDDPLVTAMVGSVGSAKDAASLGASVSTFAIREEAILEPLVQEPGLSHLGALSLQAHMINGHDGWD